MRLHRIPILLVGASLALSGCGGDKGGGADHRPAARSAPTPAEPAQALVMTRLRFRPRDVTAAANTILAIHNAGEVGHDFKLRRDGEELGGTPILNPGQTLNLEVRYPPGRYEMYCSVPGHEESGMRGTFTVE